MKKLQSHLFALALSLTSTAFAQGTTAFTYQGRLDDSTGPAHGRYDLKFTLYNAATGGSAAAGPLTNTATGITNGLFTATLDFGASPFTGSARWLELAVRTNSGGAFLTLSPRQALTPTPYALYTPSAGAAATASSAASVAANGVVGASLQPNVVTSDKIADGAITAADLSPALASNTFWRLGGNIGTTPDTHFLGTRDNQALELRVNGERALRLEPNTNHAPNSVGGSPWNVVDSGVVGATIAGGGGRDFWSDYIRGTNRISAHFGVIGGGFSNAIQAQAEAATIAGGRFNLIRTDAGEAAIGGGLHNRIEVNADRSVIGGGIDNTIGSNAWHAVIAGGFGNVVQAEATSPVLGGGSFNTTESDAGWSVLAGGYGNTVGTNSYYSAIGGGQGNVARGPSAVVSGGSSNTIQTGTLYATVGGGFRNTIASNTSVATIGGGGYNEITTNAQRSVIAGGWGNRVAHEIGFVGGGWANEAGAASSQYGRDFNQGAVVVGGFGNRAEAPYSFVGGGYNNAADKPGAIVVGGSPVYVGTNSAGWWFNRARGISATVPGGAGNTAQGDFSFAAGLGASALHDGCFVWADSTVRTNWFGGPAFTSSSSNQFLIRALGGVGINTTNPLAALDVVGTIRADAFVSSGSQPASFGSLGVGTATPQDALLDVEGNMHLNDYDLFLRGGADRNHGLGWYGLGKEFAGVNLDGPVLYGCGGGALGTICSTPQLALRWDNTGRLMVDPSAANSGSLTPGLTFGLNSGEGIASKRTVGGNQFGLDFYTDYANRMTILQNGNVGIGTLSPVRRLHVMDGSGATHAGGSIQVGMASTGGDPKLVYFGDGDYVHVGENGADDTMELKATRFFFTGGNLGIGTNNPVHKIHLADGAYCNGTQWVNASDRDAKTGFSKLDPQAVLDKVATLPVASWRYRSEPEATRHIGPTAQDFRAAFGLGDSDKAIGTVDADGVALAAIQGLNQKLEETRTELKRRDVENAELKARLEKLERLMNHQNEGIR
jgi:hypothetical protein